jgi:flagellar hook assembly protein FlgD
LAAAPVPDALQLHQNQPNPCNPLTTISYSLPKAGHVTLAIHDVRGALVATLVAAEVQAGEHAVEWRGLDSQGLAVPSGVYLARLETATGVRVVKVIMAR